MTNHYYIGSSKFILRHSFFSNHFLVSSHDSIFVSLFSVLFKLSSLFASVLRALYFLGFFSSSRRIYLVPQRRTMSRPCFLGYTIPLSILLALYYTSFPVRQNNGFRPLLAPDTTYYLCRCEISLHEKMISIF